MRKMLNKKGFSLVELMIVVVIMGILIAVAIPLYGGIQKNANNKTCDTNIKDIKSMCATYMTSYNTKVTSLAELSAMFDDGEMPKCPVDTNNAYKVEVKDNGSAVVQCPNVGTDDHAPSESGTVETALQ